jgi:hypothetical protein
VVIKYLYVALVLSIAALVAVALAVYLRVRRHLDGKAADTEAHITTEAAAQDERATPPEET